MQRSVGLPAAPGKKQQEIDSTSRDNTQEKKRFVLSVKCFRSVYRSKIALLFFSPALEINDFSNQRIFFFLLVPFLHRGFKKKALRAQTVH